MKKVKAEYKNENIITVNTVEVKGVRETHDDYGHLETRIIKKDVIPEKKIVVDPINRNKQNEKKR